MKLRLSSYAGGELSNNWWKHFWIAWLFVIFLLIAFVVMPNLAMLPFRSLEFPFLYPALYWLVLSLLSWFIVFFLRRKEWLKDRRNIFLQNEKDYGLSLKLKEALEKISSVESSTFRVTENQIGGPWKPFRVEHFLSNSLRAEITGTGGFLLPFHGHLKGIAIPNLLDSSSILFLKNDERTLRVIVPGLDATKEMLAKTIETVRGKIEHGTHVDYVLLKSFVSNENFLNPLSHPSFIDELDSACELPFDKRPDIMVKGQEIQKGVAIATALNVKGEEKVFLASGFFQKLINTVQLITKTKTELLKPAEVVQ